MQSKCEEPEPKRPGTWAVATLAVAALVSLVAWVQPVSNWDSDPAVLLVSSQALLDFGSAAIDPYGDREELSYSLVPPIDYRLRPSSAGLRYYSIGAPFMATPLVAAAQALGFDMARRSDERRVQEVGSALGCGLVLVLIVGVCRTELAAWPALLAGTLFFLGTGLVSTLATGLWTHHVAVVAAALVLRLSWGGGRKVAWWRLAVALAVVVVAATCRPTAAFLALVPLAVFSQRVLSPRSLGALVVVVVGLGLTVELWSPLFDFLPSYHRPSRLKAFPAVDGLLGSLVSPSRGLLVTSPLVLLGLGAWKRCGVDRDRPLVLATSLWIVIVLWFVSGRPIWWGGHAFGARMLVDVLPGFAYLMAVTLRRRSVEPGAAWGVLFPALAFWGVLIHSVVGLFQPAVSAWNHWPNIDEHRQLLWSWRYPQWASTETSLDRRWREAVAFPRRPVQPPEEIDLYGANAAFLGWHQPEEGWRWSRRRRPKIRLTTGSVDGSLDHEVVLHLSALIPQSLAISWQGRDRGHVTLKRGQLATARIQIGRLQANAGYELDLTVEKTGFAPRDSRELGVSLHSMRIVPVAETERRAGAGPAASATDPRRP